MTQYIIRRLLQVPPLIFGITIITFALINIAPGDPVTAMLDPQQMELWDLSQIEERRRELGLDQPIPVRYVLWLGELLQGNFGYSYQPGNQPVLDMILRRIPATLLLMTPALIIGATIGVSLGVLAALRPYSLLDNVMTVIAFFGISVPGYFIAIILMFVFSAQLGWLPVNGMWTAGGETGLNWDLVRHMILPVTALAIFDIAGYMRYTRASMLEAINSDYVTTARAKGLKQRAINLRHVFRNALLPLVTISGLQLPALIGGSFIIESLFTWPGLGLLGYNAILRRDYPVQMGVALFTALIVLAANLITDIAYTAVDPRIRYE